MYAAKKGWDLGALRITLTLMKDPDGNTVIERLLHGDVVLSGEQWDRLLTVASKTPVTRTLAAGSLISTSLSDSTKPLTGENNG